MTLLVRALHTSRRVGRTSSACVDPVGLNLSVVCSFHDVFCFVDVCSLHLQSLLQCLLAFMLCCINSKRFFCCAVDLHLVCKLATAWVLAHAVLRHICRSVAPHFAQLPLLVMHVSSDYPGADGNQWFTH